MSERMDGWRECADPVELAAAVAAGVEVLWNKPGWSPGAWGQSTASSEASFAAAMREGNRYRVPASWSWSPEPPAPAADIFCTICGGEGAVETSAGAVACDCVEPPAPVTGDDLPERRVWTCKIGGRVGRLSGGADAPMRRAVADAFTAETGRPVEFCFSGWGDDLDESELAVVEDRAPDPETIRAALVKRLAALPDPSPGVTSMACDHPNPCTSEPPVPPWPDGVLRDAANRLRWIANSGYIEDPGIKRIIRSWADELDATLVPPWPGAVLSGLTDEDGVPTWLAQAGQVRGEAVRFGTHGAWWPNTVDDFDPDNDFVEDRWVEVRDPRTVPVPETERVPWWEANDRELVDGLLCVENAMIREVGREGDRVYVCGYEDPDNPDEDDRGDWKRNYWFGRDGFDGTVEVLKDGDR